MPLPIEDYALIGDCETAALVGKDGSIDWLCWPRFDSEACFAALLGTPENGRWLLGPVDPVHVVTRRYRGECLILETRYETSTGSCVVVDVMPPRHGDSNLVRIVYGERGTVQMRMELVIRFGYGACVPWVHRLADGSLRAIAGPDQLVLRTPISIGGVDQRTVGEFTIAAGQSVPFALSYRPSHLPPPDPTDPYAGLAEAERFWSEWSSHAHCKDSEERALVMRSLITLKALTYAPTGGIVAAPTTSLPESLGGARNWDYRYCWLRDATLTLLALMNGGYFEEAAAWRDWLLRAVAGSPERAQIMYGIAGERALYEHELDHLPGYEGSKPVRIGNAAHDQLQLDVYGEVMDAFYQAFRGGVPNSAETWSVQRKLLEHLETVWRLPDRGIWESRGEPRHYTYSKVMAWVAFDRGIKLAREAGLEGPVAHWEAIAAQIHADVCVNGYEPALGSFVEAYGSTKLDGALLLLPTTGFLPIEDPRIVGTIRAIENQLVVGGFVMRHHPSAVEIETGLVNGEGSFLACSFWLADAMILMGREAEGRALFERLLALRNDVGLLSEEYDVRVRRLVGNFPQAFSHIALVTTAQNLKRASKPAEQRASEGAGPHPGDPTNGVR